MDKHSGKDNKKIHCFALILCLLGGNLLLNRFPAWQVLFSSRIPFGVLNFVDDNNKKTANPPLWDWCLPARCCTFCHPEKKIFFISSAKCCLSILFLLVAPLGGKEVFLLLKMLCLFFWASHILSWNPKARAP